MQFTDLILKFLDRLGYSVQSTIVTTITETSSDEYSHESPAILVLSKNDERVIGVFLLADEHDSRSTVSKSAALQSFAKQFDHGVEKFIISHLGDSGSIADAIEFYQCDADGQSSQIDINSFPSYSEMWLMDSLKSNKRKADCEKKRSNAITTYAYFFALVFLVLAVGDIFVEKMLDISYLNTQRTLLIIVSVLLLFIPGIIKKNCRL